MRALLLIILFCGSTSFAQVRPPTWKLAPELRIGTIDGDSNYSLSAISSIVVAGDGRMYVVLRQEKQVRVFDIDGRFVGNIGRAGNGPGEFLRPTIAGILHDTLWVADTGLMRVSFFTLDGRLAGTLGRGSEVHSATGLDSPECMFSDGSVLVRSPDNENVVSRWALLRISRSGALLDTVAVISNAHATLVLEGANPFWRATRPEPFADAPLWVCSGGSNALFVIDRAAVSTPRNARFTIRKYDLEGKLTIARSFGYTPVPLDSRVVNDAVNRFAKSIARYTGSETRARGMVRKSMYVPRFRAPLSLVTMSNDGTLWIRETMNLGKEKVAFWNVFSPSLRQLAVVRAPIKAAIVAADRDHVWTIEWDELDVPYVGRYRISRDQD